MILGFLHLTAISFRFFNVMGRIVRHTLRITNKRILHHAICSMLLNALTMKFLEQGSYTVTTEEFKQLQAVITIYKKIHEEEEKASKHPELIIDELTEPILLIDPYYSSILKEHGGRY